MKKTILLLSLILFIGIMTCKSGPVTDIPDYSDLTTDIEGIDMKNATFKELWEKVSEYESYGKPKSALEVVRLIHVKSLEEKESAHTIKAIIHLLKYRSYIEEDVHTLFIQELEKSLPSYQSPEKEILSSITADLYWQFYQNNMWTFQNRTATTEFDEGDILTWDLERLFTRTTKLYEQSLENSNLLRKTPLSEYEILLEGNQNTRKIRPTLFDLLANRVVIFYQNDQLGLISPARSFQIDHQDYFKSGERHTKLQAKEFSDDPKYKAVQLFDELIAFHSNDRQPDASVSITLQYLQFVYSNYILDDKDKHYERALSTLLEKYNKKPVATDIAYLLGSLYLKQSNNYQPKVSDDWKEHRKKAHDVATDALKRHPDSFGATNCIYLQNQVLEKSLTLTADKVLSPDLSALALVQYRNVDKLYFRLIKLSKADRKKEHKNYSNGYDDLINFYKSFKPVQEFTHDLPHDNLYNIHSAEIILQPMEKGYYVLLSATDPDLSQDENAVAYTQIWSSLISYQQQYDSNGGSYRVRTSDRESGAPLQGVKAQVWIEQYNYIKRQYEFVKKESYKTDADGTFTISSRDRTFKLEFSQGEDYLFLDEYHYQYKPYDYDKDPTKTFFFTDRSIYRPGQTIHFKGMAIHHKEKINKILPGYKTRILLYDVNWEEVGHVDVKANEYGTFSGTFTAPEDRLPGQYTIYNQDTTGQVNISIEEYKRPKFEVTFKPLRGSFKLNESIKITGEAKAYAGSAIDGAAVTYRVTRTPRYPYWNWWWGYMPTTSPTEITNGTMETEPDGTFEIKFEALPDPTILPKQKPVFSYTIYADVTDISGETHSAQTGVQIGYVALQISLDMPQTIVQNLDKPDYKIQSFNLNYEPEDASGTISVTALIPPENYLRTRLWGAPDKRLVTDDQYKSLFPHDALEAEDSVYFWETGEEVFKTSFDTKKNKTLSLNALKDWKEGKYLVQIKTKDAFGTDITWQHYISLYNTKTDKMPSPDLTWFAPVNIYCQPGDTAAIAIGSSAPDSTIFYELENEGKIIDSRQITLSNSKTIVEIPITEKYRGNCIVNFSMTRHNRSVTWSQIIYVAWSNKDLSIEFETFRDKLLPGQEEEWRIKISGPNGEKVAAEMVATLYDASLNAFKPHNWYFDIFPYYYGSLYWNAGDSFTTVGSTLVSNNWNPYYYTSNYNYEKLSWFGYYYQSYYYDRFKKSDSKRRSKNGKMKMADMEDGVYDELSEEPKTESKEELSKDKMDAPMETDKTTTTSDDRTELAQEGPDGDDGGEPIKIRTNFNETAFFMPHIKTDDSGSIIISFTIPEALTRWKMLGFTHTKNLEFGMIDNELVTQKDLMVMPNIPRFLRESDTITLTSKITNMTEEPLSGMAQLELFDAFTMEPIDLDLGNNKSKQQFSVDGKRSTVVEWELQIPDTVQAVTHRITARAGNFSDGEESSLPVLSNRMLVTESMPLPVRGKGETTFTFDKLLNSGSSKTIKHEKLTLEFTAHPVWYAIQALPYMMEYPYECSEQIFSRLYANSIATHVVNSKPRIAEVFEQWKNTDALLSNLEKNQELKALLLEETPWVWEAKNETARKKQVALLFDLVRMRKELKRTINKLTMYQTPNGGWSWFPGLPDDRYITQHITAGLGHLKQLGIDVAEKQHKLDNMTARSIPYLDNRMNEDYKMLLLHAENMDDDHIGWTMIHYLYTRSFYLNIPIQKKNQEAYDYWMGQARTYWVRKGIYMMGMMALVFERSGDHKLAMTIIESLTENYIDHDEMGIYWKANIGGWYWYKAKIETQALLIEAYSEITGDIDTVNGMKVWLLKQKQVQDWGTTKATADACYALLLGGSDWLGNEALPEITVGDIKIDYAKLSKVEAGTGYIKTSWSQDEIKPEMGKVTISKPDDDVAWGALYWQYFEQLDKITPHETPLKLTKKLFLQKNTKKGPVIEPITSKTKLKPGDLLKVRITLKTDRDMEYIHMKDMRASSLEPINVISTHKYQDGLWYYEATKDASTNFFIHWLPKGTYVFEYPLRVTHSGDFSNGITTIQCMYAPEFGSHSEGVRIVVE